MRTNPMRLWIAALCTLGLLTACTPMPPDLRVRPPAERVFAPVNFDVYAGEYVTATRAEAIKLVVQGVVASGRFLDVSLGTTRWPHTLLMRWERVGGDSTADTVKAMVQALTLFLIPMRYDDSELFTFELYRGPELLKRYRYEEPVDYALWIGTYPPNEDARIAAKALRRLFADLERDGVLSLADGPRRPPRPEREI